nr:PREDICTED: uncharacterized protein LOC105677628 [Linepithema humile]
MTVSAIDTMYFALLQYTCGMLTILSWIAQSIIDHSSELSTAAYNGMWYQSSLKAKKMLLFLIAKCRKPYRITLAKLYVISLEGYSMMKELLENVEETWKMIQVGPENEILRNYAEQCRIYTKQYAAADCKDYSSNWYMISLRSRQLLKFMLLRTIKPCQIKTGKMYVMSVQMFSKIL